MGRARCLGGGQPGVVGVQVTEALVGTVDAALPAGVLHGKRTAEGDDLPDMLCVPAGQFPGVDAA